MFTIKDDVEYYLLYTENYVRSGTCSNRRFQGFDEKKKKILTSTVFIVGPGRLYNSDSLYTVLNTLRFIPIAIKKAGGSFRKALD